MGLARAAKEMGAAPAPRAGEPLPEALTGGPDENPDPSDLPAGLYPVGGRPPSMPGLILPGEELPVGTQGRAAARAITEDTGNAYTSDDEREAFQRRLEADEMAALRPRGHRGVPQAPPGGQSRRRMRAANRWASPVAASRVWRRRPIEIVRACSSSAASPRAIRTTPTYVPVP